jgi:hypothetical protein
MPQVRIVLRDGRSVAQKRGALLSDGTRGR